MVVLKQFDKYLKGYVRYDIFALIPSWTLFAPQPVYSDYKVFYRDLYKNGEIGKLKEIIFETSHYRKTLWSGQNRQNKLLGIICKEAITFKKNKKQTRFFTDKKMKMFRNYCKHHEFSSDIADRQVTVVKTLGHLSSKANEIVFVTNISYND